MSNKHYPKGLDDRQRDENGEIREKRSDTLVKTLRQEYGPEFAQGYRSDTKLGTVRQDAGKSLSEIIKKKYHYHPTIMSLCKTSLLSK